MLIGISGKIGAGKDTVGRIIQILIAEQSKGYKPAMWSLQALLSNREDVKEYLLYHSNIKIKKFADKLKDTVCLWTGCTREQLEDQDFKDTEIGPDWVRYAKAIGFGDRDGQRIMWSNTCTKEEYEEEYRTNWQTAYKINLTYRHLLQLLGTECMRNTIHLNGWVNALFSEYKREIVIGTGEVLDGRHDISKGIVNAIREGVYPNWIITDMRFPNELEAVKSRGGITIRIEKPKEREVLLVNRTDIIDTRKASKIEHESETALDGAVFDYVIYNDGTIEELIQKVKVILLEEKVLCQM